MTAPTEPPRAEPARHADSLALLAGIDSQAGEARDRGEVGRRARLERCRDQGVAIASSRDRKIEICVRIGLVFQRVMPPLAVI